MIGAVGAQRPLPLREVADARTLEPLIALLEAAARREDVVQLLGTSPAAALLDGLGDKARAIADLVLQSIPAPEPVVVQATAARLPQAVADVLADQLFAVATEPLPSSLDASIRVLSAGSPLVGAYLERAARYLIVCRLVAAGRHDVDALVDALKQAAGTAEVLEPPVDEPAAAALLPAGTASEATPFVEHRVDVATTADEASLAARAEVADALAKPLVLLDDALPEIVLSLVKVDPEPPVEEVAPLIGDAEPLGDRPTWRALPQLVTASYHVVPVAVGLDELGDDASWIAAPSFPTDADSVLGGAAASLATRDREALRELGDRTARETPALSRAIAALRLPAPWSAELLAALAPAASRGEPLRLSEQIRLLSALTLLREAREAREAPVSTRSADELRAALMDEVAKPLPSEVRALLEAMALDPAARPMMARAVRYVLASRMMGETPTAALDELLGEELPAVGAIDRAMLRALAAASLAFRPIEPPPESRRKRVARAGAIAPIEIPAFSATVEGEIVHGELRLLDMAFADRPVRERPVDAARRARVGDNRLIISFLGGLLLLIWALFH